MTHYVFPLKTTIGGSVVEFISLALSTTQSVAPYAGVQSHLPPRLRDVTNAPADVASGKRDGSMWSHNQNTRLITSSTPERNDAATPSTSACSLVSEHNTTTPSNASSCKQQGLERARQKKKSGQRKTCRYISDKHDEKLLSVSLAPLQNKHNPSSIKRPHAHLSVDR